MSPSETRAPAPAWNSQIDVLYAAEALQARVRELGRRITQDYRDKDLVAVCVLRGAFPFYADLVRAIELPLLCEFISLSSYGDATQSSGEVALAGELPASLSGRDVLIVEDIVDTGLSMQTLQARLEAATPRSVAICTLLDKPVHRAADVPIAYRGFVIADTFVIGYGLDFRGYFRNLPFVGVYRGPT